jgi:hypothetical protein
MKERRPKIKQRELAAIFNVSLPCIHNVLSYKDERADSDTVRIVPPPSCTVKRSESILSPIPLSRLMGGSARRARLSAA